MSCIMVLFSEVTGGVCVVKYVHSYQGSSLVSAIVSQQHITTVPFEEEKKIMSLTP